MGADLTKILLATKDCFREHPPCDACGDPFHEAQAIDTDMCDDEGTDIVVLVSLCEVCTHHDILIYNAVQNVLAEMGVPMDDSWSSALVN